MMARIHILTGPVDSGKTTFLRGVLIGGAPTRPISGYLSLRVLGERETEGYDLLDLADGSERPFLRRNGEPSWPSVGPYFLIPETLFLAERIIRESSPVGLLVVDEIGPLEMSGGGVWPALSAVLKEGERDIVLVVRDGLLEICQGRLEGLRTTIYREKDRPALRKVLGRDDIAVKVKFFANHKKLFGPGEREVLLPPGSTALDLLRLLCDSIERRAEVFDGDDVRPHIVVMINGTNLPAATGTATPLTEGDHVSIFPLLGGG
jgi:nucleoside-triphosphatase THEP1/molybdopterin converting factor small subunit